MARVSDSAVLGSLRPGPRESDPVVATTLADEIAFRLQVEIIDGAYRPGQHLLQEEICRRFNVSRTPVREALRKLQAQDLVVLVPNKGATVRFPTRDDLGEIYVMRAELEGFACELAAQNIDDAARARLETAQAAVQVAMAELERLPPDDGDRLFYRPLVGSDDMLHETIFDVARNRRLRAMITDLRAAFPKDMIWRATRSLNENRTFVVDEHEAIVEALCRRDGAEARRRMERHILHGRDVLLAYLAEHEFWP